MKLVISQGGPHERTFVMDDGVFSIGRTEDNEICLVDQSLSRSHARLEVTGSTATVTDLGSKNGVFVDNQRVGRATLRAGDRFRCGEVSFFLKGEGPRSTAPALVRDVADDFTRGPASDDLLGKSAAAASLTRTRIRTAAGDDRHKERLRVLLRVSQLLAEPESGIEGLLSKILDLAARIFEIDRVSLLLVDKITGQLEPRIVRAGMPLAPGTVVHSQHVVDYVREKGVAALFADALADARLSGAQSVLKQSIRASICAPLKSKDRLLGVIYADTLSVANRFDADDLDLLVAFANQAAMALENADLQRRLEEEAVLKSTMMRFFSPATIRQLRSAGESGLEMVETEVTALFADLSGFTEMSDTMPPREVVALLNDYFPVMAEIVFRHEGTLEKYIGDALLAVWGAPLAHADDANRAVQAAVEMQNAMAGLNARWASRGRPTLQMHVGLNTGPVAAGNVGSAEYVQYATIGDTTNVASRICSTAKEGEILISERTRAALVDAPWPLSPMAPVTVKGKAQPLVLHRVGWNPG